MADISGQKESFGKGLKGRRKEKILCMFSGGLDSLGVLYLLLTRPEYRDVNIHVHHMYLNNVENRTEAEKIACENIFRYFRENKYRKFEYTESSHDMSFMRKYFIYDSVMYGFVGANMMINDLDLKTMAIGSNKDDRQNQGSIVRASKGKDTFYSILPSEIKYHRSYIYPVVNLTKQQIWNMLPGDLRELAWSCRRPIYDNGKPRTCQSCRACLEMNKIKWGDYQKNWNHRIGVQG